MQLASLTFIITILLCHILTPESVDEETVRVCPQNIRDWTAAAKRKECIKKGGDYHCVRNQDDKLVESCVPKVWIDAGDCPILYVASGNFGYEKCPPFRVCPAARYMSDTVYLYPVCFERKVVTTTSSGETTEFTTAATTPDVTGSTNNTSGTPEGQQRTYLFTGLSVLVGVLFGCSPLCIAVCCWRNGTKKGQKDVEEAEPFLPDDVPKVYLIQPLDAALGKEVTIHCVIRGALPASSVSWEKNGVPLDITDSDKYEGGSFDEPSLTIKKVSPGDAGTYHCLATNSKRTGKSNPIITKVVEFPHTFEEVELKETESIKKGKKLILDEDIVILVGKIGTGKTTAMQQILLHVSNETKEGDWKTKKDELDDELKDDTIGISIERTIFVLDDICGKFSTNPVCISKWQNKLIKLRALVKANSAWRKVLVTSTREQFNLLTNSTKEEDRRALSNCTVDLDNITDPEKNLLIEDFTVHGSCCCEKCSNICWERVMETVKEEQFLSSLLFIGWPLIRRLVASPFIAQNIDSFVDKPLITLIQGIDELRKNDTALYCGLVYIMLKGGTLDEHLLDLVCLKQILLLYAALPEHDHDLAFSKKLVSQQLKSIPEYVQYNNDKFKIFHEILILGLFCSFYKKYPNETVRLCDLQIISDLFRPEGFDNSKQVNFETLVGEYFEENGNVQPSETSVSSGKVESNQSTTKADPENETTVDDKTDGNLNDHVSASTEQKDKEKNVLAEGHRGNEIHHTSNQNQYGNSESILLAAEKENTPEEISNTSAVPVDQDSTDATSKRSTEVAMQTPSSTAFNSNATLESVRQTEGATGKTVEKKQKYCFTLSEENREVLMKRILKEDKMYLFDKHPIMLEKRYNQTY